MILEIQEALLITASLCAINKIILHGREQDLMDEIVNEQKWFYEYLVDKHPDMKNFLKGWLNRAAYEAT